MVRINGDTMKGILDMGDFGISSVNFPNNALDAINRKYLQIASMEDNVKLKKLMSICKILKDVLMTFENEFSSKYYRPFNLKFTYLQNFILTFNKLYPNPEVLPVLEKILYSYIKDLKCLTIAIIEDMPVKVFAKFNNILIEQDLLIIPEEHTKLYNIRIFIEKFARNIDAYIITATRNNHNQATSHTLASEHHFELLVQKNLIFGELGFLYVSDTLLSKFVI